MQSCDVQAGSGTFVKIDVEGFEYEVLKGLSTPVPYLSFEFVPECRGIAFNCATNTPYRNPLDSGAGPCARSGAVAARW